MPRSALVIGCGSIGRRHLRNLALAGVDDLRAFDPDPSRRAEAAAVTPTTLFESLESALEARPDAALVCAPTSMHADLAQQALAAGCHVFVEKPVATELGDAWALDEAARAAGRVLAVGHNLRFNACIARLRSWIEERALGPVRSARLNFGSFLPLRHPSEDYRVGYGARADLGGGVIFDAIHELDYALWLFGRPASVYCVAQRFGVLEIDTEDVAEHLLRYPDEKIVSIHLDFLQQPNQRWCEVVGDDGYARIDLVTRETRLFRGAAHRFEEDVEPGDANDEYVAELRAFLAACDGSQTTVVTAAEAAASLELALAAKQSARTNEAIDL